LKKNVYVVWSPLWSSVRVLGYRSGGPGSIPGTTKKNVVGSGTGSTQPREYNWGATWKKSSGSCPENREYGRRDPSRWPRGTLYPQKLAITSPTSGGRLVSIVCSRTQTMEFSLVLCVCSMHQVSSKTVGCPKSGACGSFIYYLHYLFLLFVPTLCAVSQPLGRFVQALLDVPGWTAVRESVILCLKWRRSQILTACPCTFRNPQNAVSKGLKPSDCGAQFTENPLPIHWWGNMSYLLLSGPV
jgi:hypothetical protein